MGEVNEDLSVIQLAFCGWWCRLLGIECVESGWFHWMLVLTGFWSWLLAEWKTQQWELMQWQLGSLHRSRPAFVDGNWTLGFHLVLQWGIEKSGLLLFQSVVFWCMIQCYVKLHPLSFGGLGEWGASLDLFWLAATILINTLLDPFFMCLFRLVGIVFFLL